MKKLLVPLLFILATACDPMDINELITADYTVVEIESLEGSNNKCNFKMFHRSEGSSCKDCTEGCNTHCVVFTAFCSEFQMNESVKVVLQGEKKKAVFGEEIDDLKIQIINNNTINNTADCVSCNVKTYKAWDR